MLVQEANKLRLVRDACSAWSNNIIEYCPKYTYLEKYNAEYDYFGNKCEKLTKIYYFLLFQFPYHSFKKSGKCYTKEYNSLCIIKIL